MRRAGFCIAGIAMEHTFGNGYGYVHDARLVQLFIIRGTKVLRNFRVKR